MPTGKNRTYPSSVPDGIWKKMSIVHNERPVYMYNGTAAVKLFPEKYVQYHIDGGKDEGERYLYYTSPMGKDNECWSRGVGWFFSLKTPKDDLLTVDGCAVFSGMEIASHALTPDLIEGEWYQNQLTGRPLGVVSIAKARE